MARNDHRGGDDSSRSASPIRKQKRRKECSRSRSRGAVKSKGKRCSPSRSQSRTNNKKKGRSRSAQRNRSPSRKRAQSPDRKRRSKQAPPAKLSFCETGNDSEEEDGAIVPVNKVDEDKPAAKAPASMVATISTQRPSNPGVPNIVPNIAAMTSAVGADLGTARSLAGFLQPGGLTLGAGLNLSNGPPFQNQTTQMDFSKPKKDMPTVAMDVQKSLVPILMTPDHRQILALESGATIEWEPERAKVMLSGSTDQLQRAQRLLNRVRTQCFWGQSEEKVRRLLKPKRVKTVRCRLSPMEGLPQCEKTLSSAHPMIKMGKGAGGENHLILPNPHRCVSRQHCIIEFDEERGGVYIHDCSTNGTFLNNIKLPPQSGGKVLLSHGDELLFKDPRDGKTEFGYIVSLYDIIVQEEQKLEGPRRLLTTEQMNMYPTRDYNPY